MAINDRPQNTRMNWVTKAWNFLTAPHPSVQEAGERRRSQLLASITLILNVMFIWGFTSNLNAYGRFIPLLVIATGSYILSRTPFYNIGTYLFTYGFVSLTYISIYLGSAGSFTAAMTSIGHIGIVTASILLPLNGFLQLTLLSGLATLAAPLYSFHPLDFNTDLLREFGAFVTIGVILAGSIKFRDVIEKDRLRELHKINEQLTDLTSNSEQRAVSLENANEQIVRRVSQLQAITELSESIAQLQELETLLPTVVSLIGERFGYYHASIYFMDETGQSATLQAANSEGGQQMLIRGHSVKLGNGAVGIAMQTSQPYIIQDTKKNTAFIDKSDLPNTRSEAAIPLIAKNEVLGILDLQSTHIEAFVTEDLNVLMAFAHQVAIALENARLLTEARAALAHVQDIYNEFTRTEWSHAVSLAEQPGFRYKTGRIEIMDEALSAPEVNAAVKSGQVVVDASNASKEKRVVMAVPVKIRGEVIGILHVESEDTSKAWDEDDISLVEAVAERAAVAMENARLFQDARRRATKEQLISQATSKISSMADIENILQTTAEELERVLGGSEVLIQFQNKEDRS